MHRPSGLAQRLAAGLMRDKESDVGDKAATVEAPEAGEKCGDMMWIGAALTWADVEANVAAQHQAHELGDVRIGAIQAVRHDHIARPQPIMQTLHDPQFMVTHGRRNQVQQRPGDQIE